MSSSRAVPYARPQTIKCTVCAAKAGGDKKNAPEAAIACLACAAYQCNKCDTASHTTADKKAHVRYPVAQLKSFIDFTSPTKPNESHTRSHLGSPGVPMNVTFDGCSTSYAVFWRAVKLYSNQPCLGTRTLTPTGQVGPYVFETYKQVGDRVLNLSSMLQSLNLEPKSRIGLYSVNRPEWIIGEQAAYGNNFIIVPLYDTLGPESAEQIIQQASVSVVICTAEKVPSLIEISAKHSNLIAIIVMPQPLFESKPQTVAPAKVPQPSHLKIYQMSEAEKIGAAALKSFKPVIPGPQDICTFCYTSGTTGMPKGAMLTHQNLINDVGSVIGHSETKLIGEKEYHISYLPLAHMFERLTITNIFGQGGATGFSRGNPLLLLEDIEELKPTTFAGVPRLYNRLYDKVLAMVNSSSPIKRWLFNTAYNQKLANLRATGVVTHPVWDRLVFKNVAAKLGGRVRVMCTGSAPIADNVLQFLRICFSCHVVEGYGQTESTAASTLTVCGDDRSFGNVGSPMLSNLVKLVDVPEMNYTSKDIVNGAPCPRGEVCFKGYNVFKGYYLDPEKTKEALDEDGWLHSGDIGMWLPDQTLKLIDRKKNIFKTAQGEYIAPGQIPEDTRREKIENVYQRCRYIAQSFVHGDGLESTLVAIVVPEEEELVGWAKSNKIAYKDFNDLIKHPAVVPLILADMAQIAKEAGLKGFEQVKTITLTATPFSVENEILTPTFKLKRNVAAQKFAKEIATMYGKGDAKPAAQIQSKL